MDIACAGGAPLSISDVDDDAALDEELALLEEELGTQETLPDVPDVPVAAQDVQNPEAFKSIESDVGLEKEFSKLALELG